MSLWHQIFRTLIFISLASSIVCRVALADTYPDKPVKISVGFAPGGAADIVARQLAAKMSQQVGQPFVVENKPGATGTLAATSLAKSPADGYTLMLASQSTMVVAPSMYKQLAYDPVTDFRPVTMLVSLPMVVVVNANLPVRSMQELIALAKNDSNGLSYASAGIGGPQHIAAELLMSMAGVKMVHIPYKGESTALADVMGGQVQFMFSNLPAAMPQVASGRLRVLAISTATRHPGHPGIPTINESLGWSDFDVLSWYGLFAPAKTPDGVVLKIRNEAVAALQSSEVGSKLTEQGFTIVGNTPEQFSAFVKAEIPRWAQLIKTANVTAE